MGKSKISRHFSNTDIKNNNIETHIAIYQDRVFGWFIEPIRLLQKVSDHCGFMILHLSLAHIEGFSIYFKGEDSRNRSAEFFRDAFKEIFPLEGSDPLAHDPG